jgi:hypothetical protein
VRISRFYAFLQRQLERPNADRTVVLLALVLLLPSIDTGLAADDYIHALMARGSAEGEPAITGFARHGLDMFRFTTGPETPVLQREGVLAWWDDPAAKLAFMRPVSSLTHELDHLLWNDSPWLMHAHSLGWAALALFGVLALYRQLLGPGLLCALAVALYALDDARGWFGSWVAARNAVIATGISVWALLLYVRARERQGARTRAFVDTLPAALLFGVALLAGEGAIAIAGYMFAHALVLDRAPMRDKLLALAPTGVVFATWNVAYRALGYGAQRSGLYFHPLGDPAGFLEALLERAPILLFAQLGGTWSDAWSALFAFPRLHVALVALSTLVIFALGYCIVPLVRREPMVRFGLLGGLLAILPASSAFSADRLLTWVAIGGCIVVARFIEAFWTEPSAVLTAGTMRPVLVPALVLWLAFDHAIVEPLFLPSRARGNAAMRDILDRAQAGVPSDPSITDKHVIYVNPAAMPLAAYVPIERAARGEPRAAFQTWLATADTEVRVSRVDAHTLRVHPRGGFLLSPPSRLLCGRLCAFKAGDRVRVGPVEIEVEVVTSDARPLRIAARFDRPLEDPIYVWRQWDDITFVPFTPPKIGQSVTLPAADWLRVTLGDVLRIPIDGRLPAPIDAMFQ